MVEMREGTKAEKESRRKEGSNGDGGRCGPGDKACLRMIASGFNGRISTLREFMGNEEVLRWFVTWW